METTVVTCDKCGETLERRQQITLHGSRDRRIDLCARHWQELEVWLRIDVGVLDA